MYNRVSLDCKPMKIKLVASPKIRAKKKPKKSAGKAKTAWDLLNLVVQLSTNWIIINYQYSIKHIAGSYWHCAI